MNYLKKNWLNLLGIALSLYPFLSSNFRPIVYSVSPNRALVLDSKHLGPAPLLCTTLGDQKVITDIAVVQIYFVNLGRSAIRSEDIGDPLRVSLSDRSGRILDYRTSPTDKSTNFSFVPSRDDPLHTFDVNFKYLNAGDGASIWVSYMGDRNAEFVLTGRGIDVAIVSSTQNLPLTDYISWQLSRQRWKLLLVMLVILTVLKGRSVVDTLYHRPIELLPKTLLYVIGAIVIAGILACAVRDLSVTAYDFIPSDLKHPI